MIHTLRYIDKKSDKFWYIETANCEMMINWGKTGAAGRYEIKEFDANKHFYFDTNDYGPHPLTSHPIFRTYFSDQII